MGIGYIDTTKPAVSIILPSYNRAHLIDRAIHSVLIQSYSNFELIVIDDGSTDNTQEVVQKMCDERIRYIRHNINRGANAARNTGIKAAKGEYLAFQDSDDEWLPKKLEKQMDSFSSASERVGVVYTGFWKVTGNRKIYFPSSRIKQKEGDIHKELLYDNFITTQAVLIKKECFESIGLFDEYLPRLQDWELFIRISEKYWFSYVPRPLVISYLTPGSISGDDHALITAYQYILKKHMDDIKNHKKILANHYFTLGNMLCMSEEFYRGRILIIKSLFFNPLSIKCLIAVLALLMGETFYKNTGIVFKKTMGLL